MSIRAEERRLKKLRNVHKFFLDSSNISFFCSWRGCCHLQKRNDAFTVPQQRGGGRQHHTTSKGGRENTNKPAKTRRTSLKRRKTKCLRCLPPAPPRPVRRMHAGTCWPRPTKTQTSSPNPAWEHLKVSQTSSNLYRFHNYLFFQTSEWFSYYQ